MSDPIRQLVEDVRALTGAAAPAVLDDAAPVLSMGQHTDEPHELYLVGLIGGKDVGKTSLVNALVGQPLSAPSSFGRGTDRVIAYCHQSAQTPLRSLLESEVPGRFEIVTHAIARLARQVLLDLPDIDSKYEDHLQLTRRMLRHMLYPLWIQSIDKYADQQPRALLKQVSLGNDPANFLFVLNKTDQLVKREGDAAAGVLRDDYAARLQQSLSLASPPRVFMIAAHAPGEFDLPALSQQLSQQRDPETVKRSMQLAGRRRDLSLLGWLDAQQLPQRLEQSQRLHAEARRLLDDRLAEPLLDQALPAMQSDKAQRWAIADDASRERIARWPIVRVLDTVLYPLMALLQKNIAPRAGSAASSIDELLHPRTLDRRIQGAFAELNQLHPSVATVYRRERFWDAGSADAASQDLQRRIDRVTGAQRRELVEQAMPRLGAARAPLRHLLTTGALLWFPFVQPLLEIVLQHEWSAVAGDLAFWVVRVLGAGYLLESLGFLSLYFIGLWMWIRFDTHRRITRLLAKQQRTDATGPDTAAGQVQEWLADLLEPLDDDRRRVERLVERIEQFRQDSETSVAA
jgi:hypothetical protein